MKKGTLEPYINFDGNALEALTFYGEVFEVEPEVMLFEDMPEAEREAMGYMTGVMHGSINLGNAHLMADDMSSDLKEGNRYTLSWSSESLDDVLEVWERFVEQGANIIMPLEQTFWAEKFGILVDRFGIQWMIQKYSPFQPEPTE